jgi:hypothetical protein
VSGDASGVEAAVEQAAGGWRECEAGCEAEAVVE